MTAIESGELMRYDVLVLGGGMSVAAVRDRLELVASADPITLIPRQDIGSITWHRVGFGQLKDAIGDADPAALLATLITLDVLNEVPVVYEYELFAEEPPYGVVMMGTEVIGFLEGASITDQITGQKRGAVREAEREARYAEAVNLSPQDPAAEAADMEMAENGGHEATRFGAYPVIEAPVTIDPDETFEVSVGVDAERVRHTVSQGIEVADLDPYVQTVSLKVLLTCLGFEIVGATDELPELKIDRATLDHAPVVFRLRSTDHPPTYDPAVGVWTARLTATFFYEGTIVGEGFREIRVNQVRARHTARESDLTPVMSESHLAPMTEGTDITIMVEQEDGSGNFSVRVSSQHLDEPVPAGRIILGQDANSFAAVLVREVEASIANEVSDETLGYIGERIAGKMPEPVLDAIAAVWDKVNGPGVDETKRRVPDLLLLTDEWAIPWELMNVSLDETKPPYLGAQLNVGRWPYQYRDRLESGPLGIKGLGVMVGHYPKGRKIRTLERAEEEGRELEQQYEATMVDADPDSLDQLLTGEFEGGFTFEALHFAGHGESNPEKGTYLMYSDGKRMSVFALGRASVAKEKRAFVFVNACQVGTAEEMLGEYAGLAGTAIHAGFRGFVAPLWSVSDTKAKEVSLGLYEASVEGRAISEYLRGVRAQFVQSDDEVAHTTYMAYVFYGHPRLRLDGPDRSTE